MAKEKTNSKRKIVQYILLGAVVVGIATSILRMSVAFFAMLSLPVVVGGVGHVSTGFISAFAPFLYAVTPYVIGVGIISILLYVYLFPDKENRATLIGWSVLMVLQLIGGIYFAWL